MRLLTYMPLAAFARVAVILASITGLAQLASSQTNAVITGRVTDPSNAPVPGATVRALNVDKQTERTATSSDQGYYTLNSLDTGNYQVNVEHSGFKAVLRSGVKLDVNESLRVDFALEIGQLSERIQVTGEVPVIETNTAQLGTGHDRGEDRGPSAQRPQLHPTARAHARRFAHQRRAKCCPAARPRNASAS